MNERREITLRINDIPYTVTVEPRRKLVDVIRDDCGQTGTHIGCEHGVCGACTVLLDDEPVRACLIFAVQVQQVRRVLRRLQGGQVLLAQHGVQRLAASDPELANSHLTRLGTTRTSA